MTPSETKLGSNCHGIHEEYTPPTIPASVTMWAGSSLYPLFYKHPVRLLGVQQCKEEESKKQAGYLTVKKEKINLQCTYLNALHTCPEKNYSLPKIQI